MYSYIYKRLLYCSMFLLLFVGYTFGQSVTLGSIQAQFCNNGNITKDLDLVARAGQSIPFCIQFTNENLSWVVINIDFLDSVLTADGFKHRACNAADRPKTSFGNYVLPYEKSLFLSGKSDVQKRFTIQFPIGYQGISHGCLAYNLISDHPVITTEDTMFTVMIRNIKFIDLYVGETKVDASLHLVETPHLVLDGPDHYALQFSFVNDGNVPQWLSLSGSLDNFFGYKKSFSWSGVLIAPNETKVFSTKDFGGYYLPFYKWFFRVLLKVNHAPQYVFNLDNPTQPATVSTPGTETYLRMVVLYNWQFFATIGLLVFFLVTVYLSVFGKKKVIVVVKE